MIDENFQVWLIEVNSNPSLTVVCPLIGKLMNHLIDNVI
jgi:hypothetical protein